MHEGEDLFSCLGEGTFGVTAVGVCKMVPS